MFTGLVLEQGTITNISKNSLGMELTICAKKVLANLKIGDSIACDGVCLTVKRFTTSTFTADVMMETIKLTTLCHFKAGTKINIEPSLTLNQGLGGHLVLGDVETMAKIISITSDGFAKRYRFKLEKPFINYVLLKGRVSIDGASLTVTDVANDSFEVSLIPHSLDALTIGTKKVGNFVNIETDYLLKGKNILDNKIYPSVTKNDSKITKSFLAENGFL